jgi:peptide/nickel transport system substrate-binding protein
VQGDRIELERNADYWGEMPRRWRSATFKFISDPDRRLLGDDGRKTSMRSPGYPAPGKRCPSSRPIRGSVC